MDTLQFIANDNRSQELIALLQAIMLLAGAIINLLPRKRH